jgi:hypothetical protein
MGWVEGEEAEMPDFSDLLEPDELEAAFGALGAALDEQAPSTTKEP